MIWHERCARNAAEVKSGLIDCKNAKIDDAGRYKLALGRDDLITVLCAYIRANFLDHCVNAAQRAFDDPFAAIDKVLKAHPLGGQAQAIVVDIHCEATSEKMAAGHFCDGRASVVVGTHTHVPTGDAMILPGGTAYMTDAGMCGDYNSVIGMEKAEPMRRFVTGMPKSRFTPAMQEATLSGLYVETDNLTGKAVKVAMVRQGGRLSQTGPA